MTDAEAIDLDRLAAENWQAEEPPPRLHAGTYLWYRMWRRGPVLMIASYSTFPAAPNDGMLIVSVSHSSGRLTTPDRYLNYVRPEFRSALTSYAHAVRGGAQAKWLGFI